MIALALLAANTLYGNVFMHPETGDMLGTEVGLHGGGRRDGLNMTSEPAPSAPRYFYAQAYAYLA